MQTIPDWSTTDPVTSPTATVTVNGTVIDAEQVSITRRAVTGGMTAATGTVEAVAPDDVTSRVRTPWSRQDAWPPVSGAPVTVRMGDAYAGDVQVLTGVVDLADGSVADGSVSLDLVDHIDRLHRPFTHAPIAAVMPPRVDGRTRSMYPQLNTLWLTDRILRRCGFHATPNFGSGAVVSATMMGSTWPEVGTLDDSIGTNGAYPRVIAAPWGIAIDSVDATYLPSGADRSLSHGPFELLHQVPDTSNPYARIFLGPAYYIRLNWGSASIFAEVRDGPGATPVTIASAPRVSTTQRAILRIETSGSTLTLTVRTDTGGEGTGTATVSAGMTASALSGVHVYAAAGRSTGPVIARWPGESAFSGLNHEPTTIYRRGLWHLDTTITTIPAIVGRDALNLLTEQAKAQAAAFWLDEQGRAVWADRAWLNTGNPVRDLTATHDLLDLTWSHDHRDTASLVTVNWQSAAVQRSLGQRVTVWEGSAGALDDGTYEHVLHPEPLTDWLGVDTTVTLLPGNAASIDALNRMTGTLLGAAQTDDVSQGGEGWSPSSVFSGVSMRHVDPRAWVFSYTVTPGAHSLTARVPDDSTSTGVWRVRYGDRLPVVRARGIITRVEESTTSTTVGPTDAPELVHDAGWHVQDADHARALADWLAGHHTAAQPVLQDVPVVYDPRLQLGDTVRVIDDARSLLRVTGRIVGIVLDVRAGSADMRLSILTRLVERLDVTLGEYDTVWAAATLSARDTEWSGESLAGFDNNPLRRA